MPPFDAVKGFGELRNDKAITQEELHLIADWVEGGSPEGEPALLPKPPDFTAATDPADKPPKTGAEVVVDGRLELTHPTTFVGARAKALAEGASIKAVAQLPDGVIEQLIWIYNYKPKYDQTYYFSKPLAFPAGTKIETYPAGGSLALVTKK